MYNCGSTQIAFDASGAISQLTENGYEWADAEHTLLSLRYRSYSAADVAAFFATYCKSSAGWVQHDYGKPGLPDDIEGKVWPTSMTALYVKAASGAGTDADGSGTCSFRIKSAFDPIASEQYGAAAGWVSVDINSSAKGNVGTAATPTTTLNVEVGMFNKSTTRLPEAMFMQFQTHNGTSVRPSTFLPLNSQFLL